MAEVVTLEAATSTPIQLIPS